LEAIIISLRMLAIQGSAFRGHIESEDSLNRGNFLELMNVIASFNDIVKKKSLVQKMLGTYTIQFRMKLSTLWLL